MYRLRLVRASRRFERGTPGLGPVLEFELVLEILQLRSILQEFRQQIRQVSLMQILILHSQPIRVAHHTSHP